MHGNMIAARSALVKMARWSSERLASESRSTSVGMPRLSSSWRRLRASATATSFSNKELVRVSP